jgi:hypothetical protein
VPLDALGEVGIVAKGVADEELVWDDGVDGAVDVSAKRRCQSRRHALITLIHMP